MNLISKGAICQSTTDTEVILHLVARSEKRNFVERFVEALLQVEGAYAFVGMTNKKLIGAGDPHGIRPLVLGRLGDAWVLSSESCALDIIGADTQGLFFQPHQTMLEQVSLPSLDKAGETLFIHGWQCA